MKLYYTPGACSMAPHIALREAGLAFDLEKVDLATRKTESGRDYTEINPKGYVPALELDDGDILTECGVMLQFIGDQNPACGLVQEYGTRERYHLMEMIHFLATEVHKPFGPLFWPQASAEAKQAAEQQIRGRFDYLNGVLADREYLTGDQFRAPDCYFTTILGWTRHLEMDLSPWPNIGAYAGRVMGRPAVQETLKAEGLM